MIVTSLATPSNERAESAAQGQAGQDLHGKKPSSFKESLMSSIVFARENNAEESVVTDPVSLLLRGDAKEPHDPRSDTADRFDMTGVLGHLRPISFPGELASTADLQTPLQTDDAAFSNLDLEEKGPMFHGDTPVFVEKPKVEKVNIAKLSAAPMTTNRIQIGLQPAMTLGGDNLNPVAENDIGDAPIDVLADGAEPVEKMGKEAPRTSAKPVLDTLLNHTRSNPIFVALHTLDNGLRFFARVQNMSQNDLDALYDSVKAMLKENGYHGASITIDQPSFSIQSKQT